MRDVFSITQGVPDIYVGLHIVKDQVRRTLQVDQTMYIQCTFWKFGFDNCHFVIVLANPNT